MFVGADLRDVKQRLQPEDRVDGLVLVAPPVDVGTGSAGHEGGVIKTDKWPVAQKIAACIHFFL